MDLKTLPLKNSIAARMLVVVLGLYMVIAACITSSHVWMEYNYQKSNIVEGLGDIESAFNSGLAVSLWGLDQESLTASVKGMLKIPTLVGVKIITDEGGMIAIGGIVNEQGEAGNAGLHVNLSGLTESEIAVHKGESYNLEMFERQFPIVYELEGKSMLLGRATIYSNSSVIVQRMKLQIAMLGINVALTLITFSLALWWAINRYLRRPLVDLASSAEKVTLENLDSFRVTIATSGRNELKALEESFNAMIGNLNQSMAQRKQAEEALSERDVTFRKLFEESSDAILLIDGTGVFVECNQAALELLKMTRELFLFLPPTSISPEFQPDGRRSDEAARDMIAQAYSKGLHRFDWTCVNAEGREFIVEVSLMPITLRGQTMLHTTWRDITERKRVEEERRKLEQQMLHAQKLESLGVLAGGIAHDFNNLLMAIMGNADLALMRLNPESPAIDNLKRIEQASVRAADLAKQMLAYSGKGKFVVEHLDMSRLVEEMLHMLEVSISKKAVLRFNLTTPIPSVEADATQIRQIIMNLVINASEAIGDKSGVISVTTGCLECDSNYLKDVWLDENLSGGLFVSLEIADSGCGMDKATMAKLFDPFFTTKFTGRGLGMAAVLGIVRGHKGAIKVYSELNKGTTFKILLPASGRPAELFNGTAHTDDWQGSGTVLLVDDEETVRAIGGEMLRELGFEVVAASDGRDAVTKYTARNDICLVIMDLTMPHMDGEQCFRELRQLNPNVKVIISSGFSEHEVTMKFAGKGLAGFIQKPYKLSALIEAIRKISSSGKVDSTTMKR